MATKPYRLDPDGRYPDLELCCYEFNDRDLDKEIIWRTLPFHYEGPLRGLGILVTRCVNSVIRQRAWRDRSQSISSVPHV